MSRGLARTFAVAIMCIVAAVLTVVASAAVADGTGGCSILAGTCTVGQGGGGGGGGDTPGGGNGSPVGDGSGGGSGSVDPCVKSPLSPQCLNSPTMQCTLVALDWFDGSGLASANNMTPAQLASLNAALSAKGCPTYGTGEAPAAPDPADVARQALATIHFPKPSGHRSPSETQLYNGLPFSYVNLWVYGWTDPATWQPLSASATVAGVTASVTAKPTTLSLDPGDGSSVVTCNGPGRAWTDADGNNAPADGACGYQYSQVTSSPITTTQTITWSITWTGTGGAAGEFPSMTQSTSGQLNVMQIQVVTR